MKPRLPYSLARYDDAHIYVTSMQYTVEKAKQNLSDRRVFAARQSARAEHMRRQGDEKGAAYYEDLARCAAVEIDEILTPEVERASAVLLEKEIILAEQVGAVNKLIASTDGRATIADICDVIHRVGRAVSDAGLQWRARGGAVIHAYVAESELPNGNLSATFLQLRIGVDAIYTTIEAAGRVEIDREKRGGLRIWLADAVMTSWLCGERATFFDASDLEADGVDSADRLNIEVKLENVEAIEAALAEANKPAWTGLFDKGRPVYRADVISLYGHVRAIVDDAADQLRDHGVAPEHQPGVVVTKVSDGRGHGIGPATYIRLRFGDDGKSAFLDRAVSTPNAGDRFKIGLRAVSRKAWLAEREKVFGSTVDAPQRVKTKLQVKEAVDAARAAALADRVNKAAEGAKVAEVRKQERPFDESDDAGALLGGAT